MIFGKYPISSTQTVQDLAHAINLALLFIETSRHTNRVDNVPHIDAYYDDGCYIDRPCGPGGCITQFLLRHTFSKCDEKCRVEEFLCGYEGDNVDNCNNAQDHVRCCQRGCPNANFEFEQFMDLRKSRDHKEDRQPYIPKVRVEQ